MSVEIHLAAGQLRISKTVEEENSVLFFLCLIFFFNVNLLLEAQTIRNAGRRIEAVFWKLLRDSTKSTS